MAWLHAMHFALDHAKRKALARPKQALRNSSLPKPRAKSQKRIAKSDTNSDLRTYTIRDYRLESPLHSGQVRVGGKFAMKWRAGSLAARPPIRESEIPERVAVIEIYRWMLLNRRMETALENLYKQGQVVGGVYFVSPEACSCRPPTLCIKNDWLGPMIANQERYWYAASRPPTS